MATQLERPKTPLSVVVVGAVIAGLLGLFLLRAVIGFVTTLAKVGIAAAIIVAVVLVISRATGDDA